MKLRIRQSVAAALVVLVPTLASAQSAVTGLYNTGVDASGTKLGVGVADPHYTVVQNGGAAAFTVNNGAYAQTANSNYIWQTAGSAPEFATLTFRTTFTLAAGMDPLTAMITGMWSTDNLGLDILVNGVSSGMTSPTFTVFTPFTLASGFMAGTNTIDFVVQNQGGPGGLNVTDLQGTARALGPSTTVPEPATIVLMGSGLAALGFFGARRRTQP